LFRNERMCLDLLRDAAGVAHVRITILGRGLYGPVALWESLSLPELRAMLEGVE
jgi:hypothetical protein